MAEVKSKFITLNDVIINCDEIQDIEVPSEAGKPKDTIIVNLTSQRCVTTTGTPEQIEAIQKKFMEYLDVVDFNQVIIDATPEQDRLN